VGAASTTPAKDAKRDTETKIIKSLFDHLVEISLTTTNLPGLD
jgi:hypothetical protein